MNVYLNLTKTNYEGDSDLLTVEVPSSYTDELLRHVRPIAEDKNVNAEKILKDIIKELNIVDLKIKDFYRLKIGE